jgi:ribosomal protein S18 acetylase RimI-like enzyme
VNTLSEAAVASALERNLAAAFKALVCATPGGTFHDGPELCWSLSHVPFAAFNSIFGAHLDGASADDAIEAAKARGRENNVPLLWWIAPENTPADLAARLSHAGFTRNATPPAMTLDLARFHSNAAAENGAAIVATAGDDAARTWRDTFQAGFACSPAFADAFLPLAISASADPSGDLSNYVMWVDDRPVAVATLMMSEDTAGIYNVATVPSVRGRGLGSAMSLHVLHEGRKRGATMAVLQSSIAGVGMYQRLGFQESFNFEQYVWRP